jgi:hypothetical protein
LFLYLNTENRSNISIGTLEAVQKTLGGEKTVDSGKKVTTARPIGDWGSK